MKKHEFGRLYTLNTIAQCLVVSCSGFPYEKLQDDGDAKQDEPSVTTVKPLVSWTRLYWEEFEERLDTIRKLCIRADSNHLLSLNLDDEEVKYLEKPNVLLEKNASSSDFQKKYRIVMQLCKVQHALAPIRERLEDAVDEYVKSKTNPEVNQDELKDMEIQVNQDELKGMEIQVNQDELEDIR
jgi:hypothetical protein